jgi:hypothetical protein
MAVPVLFISIPFICNKSNPDEGTAEHTHTYHIPYERPVVNPNLAYGTATGVPGP